MNNTNMNNSVIASSTEITELGYVQQCAESFNLWHDKSAIAGICHHHDDHYVVSDGYAQLLGVRDAEDFIFNKGYITSKSCYEFLYNAWRYNFEVLKSGKPVISLEVHKFATGLGIYRFHREPIIDPSTNKVVAVRFRAEPFCLHITNRILSTMYKPKSETTKNFITENLGKACKIGKVQLEVMFYSLLGFRSSKDLSLTMSSIAQNKAIHCVRSAINSLNTKFGVSSIESMLCVVRALGFDKYIPSSALKCGSYRMNEEFAIVDNFEAGKSLLLE